MSLLGGFFQSEFADDIVRIIQYNINRETEQRAFIRKANITVRSIFMKVSNLITVGN